jgi:hypothetical protein
MFHAEQFADELSTRQLRVHTADDLVPQLLPLLEENVSTPGASCGEELFRPVYESILNSALRGMWKKIGSYESLATEVLLQQNDEILSQQRGLSDQVGTIENNLGTAVQNLADEIKSLAGFAQLAWKQPYEKLLDSAPPHEHKIDNESYVNPFLLVKAEDFNHNYKQLARLFQSSPEWDSIQRPPDNVFIEGGRGTGKSMLLRRLTAQATVAAQRLEDSNADPEQLDSGYFGVYVKLTRGYYDQFSTVDTVKAPIAQLLAQHELNIEIFDAFVDTIRWLVKEGALPSVTDHMDQVVMELKGLFDNAPDVHALEDLQRITVRFEQDQITTFYREKAFGREVVYGGSARDTVAFLRNLSHIFRNRLFPRLPVRLFILIDEFETLLDIQQIAINTAIKMRLPDLTFKIAVRTWGRKTSDTFTPADPIQQPRDYTEIQLDYNVTSGDYSSLLAGIAAKRLSVAGYPDERIQSYLISQTYTDEVRPDQLESKLQEIWKSGHRKADEPNEEFKIKYTPTAVYRIVARAHKTKSFAGFDQYVLLSSGIVSNFIELCKYAFYFALSDQLPLRIKPEIPTYTQTTAAHQVSQRLFDTIDGNVPNVGAVLKQLVADLSSILRNRLLKHPSEPEANRLEVTDYGALSSESLLAKVLNEAVVWSVLHMNSAGASMRPKNAARPPSAEFIINRIYCPALGISPRARWRVKIQLSDLHAMIEQVRRLATYKKLMKTIGGDHTDGRKPGKGPQSNLFSSADTE